MASKHLDDVLEYCDGIMSKKIVSGEYTKLAVKRFLLNTKEQKKDSFDYELIPEMADEVIDFAQSLLIPTLESEDKHLRLLGWMKFQYYNIWGWRYKDDWERMRFNRGYCEVQRKNSKTTSIMYPWLLYDFMTRMGARSFFVSGDGKQAIEAYENLVDIIKEDEQLMALVQPQSDTIYCEKLHSKITFFSSETRNTDSYINTLTIFDEYHEYTSRKIYDAFTKGGRTKKNNLRYIITSAGTNIHGPCYKENNYCKRVLNGLKDENYFGIIYAYDDGDDWKDPKNLMKGNPSMGDFVLESKLLEELNEAIIWGGQTKTDFLSKTCGIWTSAVSDWIPLHLWLKNKNVIINEEELLGKDCYAGLDLSLSYDLSAFTLYFKIGDKYVAKHHFYMPASIIEEKSKAAGIDFQAWIDEGFITATPGNTIDYEYIFNDIIADSQKYKIKEIAYDRNMAKALVNQLDDAVNKILLIPYNQSKAFFSAGTKLFQDAIRNEKNLIIDNNPVMAWMIGNAVVQPDANGNIKPEKKGKSSHDHIDGVITSIMAFDRLYTNGTAKPPQELNMEITWI